MGEASSDQSLRELQRQAQNAPKSSQVHQSLAALYLRQNKLSEAIEVLQSVELFVPENPIAQSIAAELKRIQQKTLKQLHPETRVWSWPKSQKPNPRKPETLIPIKELTSDSPVIQGLLFREKDWSILRSSQDVQLWLQSLSITRADIYGLPLLDWINALPNLWQLSIQFNEVQKKRSKALLRHSRIQDLLLIVEGYVSDHFFKNLAKTNLLKTFTYYGSLLNLKELPFQNMDRLTSLTLALHRPLSEHFHFRFPPQLQELAINTPTLSKQSVRSLASLASLRSLDLIGVRAPQDLSFLENYHQLQSLTLSSSLFIEALHRIPNTERIKHLTLDSALNPPSLFEPLVSLQGLNSLSIDRSLLTDDQLTHLNDHFPQLTDLHVF